MPWDDFLDELQTSTGLTPAQLVEVVRRRDPQYARQRAEEERLERERERRAAREAAETKARALLLEHLTPEQTAEFLEHNQFHVTSSKGNRFLIRLGRQHNVWLVDENDQRITNYCTSIRDPVPDEDNVLAQKLLLESDEDLFMSRANQSAVR